METENGARVSKVAIGYQAAPNNRMQSDFGNRYALASAADAKR